ncbi:MAG: hypothetical protein HOV81_24720 [Kofleriaceae bacterium]|nr:hypothetical protein [Kofleriaceae bacterium]
MLSFERAPWLALLAVVGLWTGLQLRTRVRHEVPALAPPAHGRIVHCGVATACMENPLRCL